VETVSVVGLGAMGGRIARRLLARGVEVLVWNRAQGRAAELAALGAVPVRSPAEAARRAAVVVVVVSDDAALRAVLTGPDGLAAGASPGSVVVQMSTVGVDAAAEVARALPHGADVLDAPVLGSVDEAAAGTLKIFAGGADRVVERCAGLLALLGTTVRTGPLGSGTAAKLVANSALFGVLGVLGESVALAERLGLDRRTAFDVLATTPLAAQAERRRPAVDAGTYPPRFALSLARKDAGLVLDAAERRGARLRLAAAVASWLADAEATGRGEQDYTAMLAQIMEPTRSSPAKADDDFSLTPQELPGGLIPGRVDGGLR
jgi:3-hydroxyisobutyrate dehydrogenase